MSDNKFKFTFDNKTYEISCRERICLWQGDNAVGKGLVRVIIDPTEDSFEIKYEFSRKNDAMGEPIWQNAAVATNGALESIIISGLLSLWDTKHISTSQAD